MYLSLSDIIIDEIHSFNSNCKDPQEHVNHVHGSSIEGLGVFVLLQIFSPSTMWMVKCTGGGVLEDGTWGCGRGTVDGISQIHQKINKCYLSLFPLLTFCGSA